MPLICRFYEKWWGPKPTTQVAFVVHARGSSMSGGLAGQHCRPARVLVATTDGADRAVTNRLSRRRVTAAAERTA